MVGGWLDGYRKTPCCASSRVTRGQCKGLIGPWAHVYPHDGTPGPAIGFLQEAVRWWDHWLKGADNGMMSEPKLRVYAQQPIRRGRSASPGRPVIAEPGWPSPNVSSRTFVLAAPGQLQGPGAEQELQIRGTSPSPPDPGPWCGWGGPLDHAADQGGNDGRSLAFHLRAARRAGGDPGLPVGPPARQLGRARRR